MLRSSNPILSKRDAFTPAAPQYGQSQYQQNPYGGPGYGPQGGWQQPGGPTPYTPYGAPMAPAEARMTFDDVVTKTVITMSVLVAGAVVSWWGVSSGFVPARLMMPALLLSALVGFVTVMVVSFRRKVSAATVLVYAAVEGIFIGMLSLLFETMYQGIVMQAVIGTFVAAGVTLAAYKLFNIRVTSKFRKVVTLATIGFAMTMLVNLLFSLFGANLGLVTIGSFNGLSLLMSAVGVTLAVLNLVLDFDYIERGVQMGAPASESWRGAFGLTVTMVWLYVELLRILSYLRR